MSYWRFLGMIVTSTIVMYGLMYANSYAWEHLYYSESRVYMAFYMGATMAVIMLLFMLSMYTDKMINMAIFGGSAIVFAGALYLFRSQDTIGDQAWMKAMIPHHSIAIMTSERAELSDPMTEEEITRALGTDATCRFERAVDADPIFATVDGRGVAKISGSLILLEGDAATMEAEGIRMTLTPPDSDAGEGADLIFDLMTEPALRVGFDGYLTCS